MKPSRRFCIVAFALLVAILASPLVAAEKPEAANPPLQVNDDPAKLLPPGDGDPSAPGKGASGPNLGPAGVPANDLCANAQAVTVPSATPGTTVDATFDGVGTCGTSNTAPGVWYTFTPAASGTYRASTCNAANYDTKISVFTGSCGALGCVGGNDDFAGCAGFSSRIDFGVAAGTPVRILVHGFGSAVGSFTLSLSLVSLAPANDTCAAAIPVAVPSTTAGTTVGAIPDTSFPQCGTSITAGGVWYEVTGTGNVLDASTCTGTAYDSKLTVFCQDCATPTCITGNDDSCGLQSRIQWESEPGATYRILVHGFGAATGAFSLTLADTGVASTNPVACGALGACCNPETAGCEYTDFFNCGLDRGTFNEGYPCVTTDRTTSIARSPALAIPDANPTGVFDTATVPDDGLQVAGVSVDVGITHTYIGDLRLRLEQVSSGQIINMWDYRCSSTDNMNTTFIDGGTTTLCSVVSTGGGQVDPTVAGLGPPFSTLQGTPSGGNWRLRVDDAVAIDTGTLNTWTLHVDEGRPVCFVYPSPLEIPTADRTGLIALAVLLAGAAAFLLWRRRG